MLFAAWRSEFRAEYQIQVLAYAHRHGIASLTPETRHLVAQTRQEILSPKNLAAYDPAHDRSFKSLAAALAGLLLLFLVVGPSALIAATVLLLVAEIRRPRIQKWIQIAQTLPT